MPTVLGKDEGIISPVWGWEKHEEVNVKIMEEGAKQFFPKVKETFNIPVEDAIGAAKLATVAGTLQSGPENESEIVEATPERVVRRITKCQLWEMYKDGVDVSKVEWTHH